MVEIYETRANKDGFFVVLRFDREEIKEAHGWDYLWHIEKFSKPPEGIKALLESVIRSMK